MAEDNVILVTFEEESKAYQAASVLKQADVEGRIVLRAIAIVQRAEDGTLRVKEGEVDDFPSPPGPGRPSAPRPVGSSASPWVSWARRWGFSWAVRGARCWGP
jgi:hypothetical protein